jgi:hypothetical protein
MRDAALARLERLLRDASDPDPAQWTPEPAYIEGALLAYQRIGVLSRSEADQWRARLVSAAMGRDAEPEPPLPEAARAAGVRYLERVVAGVPRFRRNPTPEEGAAEAECASALQALRAVGALDEREHTEWSRRLLAARAPWLDDPTRPPGEGLWAISIPPGTPEEAAEDAAFEAAWAARPKAEDNRSRCHGLSRASRRPGDDRPGRGRGCHQPALPLRRGTGPGRRAEPALEEGLQTRARCARSAGPPRRPRHSLRACTPAPICASSHSREPDCDLPRSSSAPGSTRPQRPMKRPPSTSSKRAHAGRFAQPPELCRQASAGRAPDEQSRSARGQLALSISRDCERVYAAAGWRLLGTTPGGAPPTCGVSVSLETGTVRTTRERRPVAPFFRCERQLPARGCEAPPRVFDTGTPFSTARPGP